MVSSFARNANSVSEGSIIAARRNQNREGDIILQITTKQEKDTLEKNNDWIKETFKSAKLLRPTYPVIIHGMNVKAVDVENQKGTIDSMKRQNAKLHPGLEITKIAWPAFAKRPTKTEAVKEYTSLLLEVTKPEMANRLVEERFIEGWNLLQCEKWDRSPQQSQCFACYRFGHFASKCPHAIRCGICAKNHDTKNHGPTT